MFLRVVGVRVGVVRVGAPAWLLVAPLEALGVVGVRRSRDSRVGVRRSTTGVWGAGTVRDGPTV